MIKYRINLLIVFALLLIFCSNRLSYCQSINDTTKCNCKKLLQTFMYVEKKYLPDSCYFFWPDHSAVYYGDGRIKKAVLNKQLMIILNCTNIYICHQDDTYIIGKRTMKEFKELLMKNCKDIYEKKYKKPMLTKKQLKNRRKITTRAKALEDCY